jgi:hypothetical protein
MKIRVGVAKPACNVMRRLAGQRLRSYASTGDKQKQANLQRGGSETEKPTKHFATKFSHRRTLVILVSPPELNHSGYACRLFAIFDWVWLAYPHLLFQKAWHAFQLVNNIPYFCSAASKVLNR